MLAVIRACGFPLAAPSANASNSLSPTNAAHVAASLGARVPLIVDGGQCQVGLESTVLDLTASPPRVLRPGMIHEESLAAVVGPLDCGAADSATRLGPLRSPGQLRQHYAPKARLLTLAWRDDADLRAQLTALGAGFGLDAGVFVLAHTRIPSGDGLAGVSVIPHDAEAFARALYAELHRCDVAGARWIIVESVPATPEWRAVADRLRRASAV
jgi:L-threonylcarbamoyladenylate synthase